MTALISQIRLASPSSLHELPLRLVRFNMATDSGAVLVLREVLDIAGPKTGHPQSEWPYIRRIVWDCYALFEPLRSEATEAALAAAQDAR